MQCQKRHDPKLILFKFASYQNYNVLQCEVMSSLFLRHCFETDYSVLKILLAKLLRWHAQLEDESEFKTRN